MATTPSPSALAALAWRWARGARSLVALTILGCGIQTGGSITEGRAWVPLHPATHEPAVAALVLSMGMSVPGAEPQEDAPLAVAIWADGTVIWSASPQARYGRPYREGRLGADVCERLRSDLQAQMLQRGDRLSSYGVPDASEEILLVRDGERVWRMSSCIDLFEAGGKVVAFAGGIAPRDSMPTLREDDPAELELKEFRAAWANAKQQLLSNVPNAGSELPLQEFELRAIGAAGR